MRSHDPERGSARYVAGMMRGPQHESFERHLLECEPCWREVRLATRGRRWAEAARELAPPHLRDRIRAAVELSPSPAGRRRRPVTLALLAVALLASVTGAALSSRVGAGGQPPMIETLAAHFGGVGLLPRPAPATLPPRLGDLLLIGADDGVVQGVPVRAHRYRSREGGEIVVYRADRSFPRAAGARLHPSGDTWEARLGTLVVYCAERPFHALVIGDDRRPVMVAARTLGLR